MASIFISYADADSEVAHGLAAKLSDMGHSAWWDRKIHPGETFDTIIAERLENADCIVALWTPESVLSEWVRDEADEGRKRGVLLPIALDGVRPPIGFRRTQCLEAKDVKYLLANHNLERLAAAIDSIVARGASSISPPIKARNLRPRDTDGEQQLRTPSQGIVVSKVFVGFVIALLSSVFWGIGNAVTKYTVADFGDLAAEVAVMKFLSAGAFLWTIGLFLGQREGYTIRSYSVILCSVLEQWVAVLATAINVLTFVFALNLLPAASVTSIENAHVIWTALILVVVFRQNVPSGWIASSVMVLIGVALITQVDFRLTDQRQTLGYVLSIISGFTLSLFTVFWAEGVRPAHASLRIFEAGTLLIFSALAMIVLAAGFALLTGEIWVPRIWDIPRQHLTIQFVNALIGIGVTYILMNEAFAYVSVEGRLASLLIGLGISFAVLFTFVGELIIFGREVVLMQWVGVLAFSIGFATVRSALIKPNARDER